MVRIRALLWQHITWCPAKQNVWSGVGFVPVLQVFGAAAHDGHMLAGSATASALWLSLQVCCTDDGTLLQHRLSARDCITASTIFRTQNQQLVQFLQVALPCGLGPSVGHCRAHGAWHAIG
jgi:hypothetical protein